MSSNVVKTYFNMKYNNLYVTGDCHGEEGRFLYTDTDFEKVAGEGDVLFIAGDFGYVWDDSYSERKIRKIIADKKYTTVFIDGNHENFDLLEDSYPISIWCGGKVHVIESITTVTEQGEIEIPKVIHLMRGQVYEISGKKIFTFGGGYSIDKYMREYGVSYWHQEMPNEAEYKEAIANLAKHDNKVDYIITHAAPKETMDILCLRSQHEKELPLNIFLEYIRETVSYERWFFGHMHDDRDLFRNQTLLWFQYRNMKTNKEITYGEDCTTHFIFSNQNRKAKRYMNIWRDGLEWNTYMLTGPSGSGKTEYLKALFQDKRAKWYRKPELDMMLADSKTKGIEIMPPREDVIFIDGVLTTKYVDEELKNLLFDWQVNSDGKRRLIIFTVRDEDKTIDLAWCEEIKISPIKINKTVVREKAKDMGIQLDDEKLYELIEQESMKEVVNELRTMQN